MSKQHTCPLILDGKPENNNIRKLEKINLASSYENKSKKLYDEAWVQNLIHNNPSLLPIEELEPAFFPLFPVCKELKTPAGYLDNLFVSEGGYLTLVECKLWKNPEARREVIGQALDYAKEFSKWQYEDLSRAITRSTGKSGNFLYEVISREIPGVDEAIFVDSVNRNLRRGRFLILIVGDGIREGVETISGFLQKHAGINFTFGLVELGFFKVPGVEQYIIQPRILARTYIIERLIIKAEGLDLKVETEEIINKDAAKTSQRMILSEEHFYEELSKYDQLSIKSLKQFIEEIKELDISPVFGNSSLNLRWMPDDNLKMNFGSINKKGFVNTSPANWAPAKIGKIDIGHQYQEQLANIIAGAYVRKHKNPNHWEVHKNNQRIKLADFLTDTSRLITVILAIQKEIESALS